VTISAESPTTMTREHPSWCVVDKCPLVEHVSAGHVVPGPMSLLVEVVQERQEREPRVWVVEADGPGLLAIPVEQVERLVEQLLHVARAVREGRSPQASDSAS
jgi:hypothetical protein